MSTAEKRGKRTQSLGERRKDEVLFGRTRPNFRGRTLQLIEGLNHAIHFGIEFFRQQEVFISCTDKEVKLVT